MCIRDSNKPFDFPRHGDLLQEDSINELAAARTKRTTRRTYRQITEETSRWPRTTLLSPFLRTHQWLKISNPVEIKGPYPQDRTNPQMATTLFISASLRALKKKIWLCGVDDVIAGSIEAAISRLCGTRKGACTEVNQHRPRTGRFVVTP